MKSARTKKIWIDLDNSPHVLFFNPIIRELKKRGYQVVVTACDYAQVIGLADLLNLEYIRIGRQYGKSRLRKIYGVLLRALHMLKILIVERPNLAFSHGSKSQFLIAKCAGIKTLLSFDSEHSEGIPLVRPTREIVSEILPCESTKTRAKFPGIKEDVYVPDFEPEPTLLKRLGIRPGEIVVTVRPPPTTGHYHCAKSDALFEAVIEQLVPEPDTKIVMLPRTAEQGAAIMARWPIFFEIDKMMIPDQLIDGLNLVWYSDLVISGGGTMLHEAAALGVPCYSIFGGRIGAIDRYLANQGRLTILKDRNDVITKIELKPRERPKKPQGGQSAALHRIVEEVETMLG